MKINRINQIENYLIEHKKASLDTLCSLFKVSKNTIRRDISELEERGMVKKVYGGVALNTSSSTVPFSKREVKNLNAKKIIGSLASTLVDDNDIIYIDSGSTTLQMIPFLKNKKNITIITNNLYVLKDALSYPNINVFSTGGTLFRNTNSFIGIETIQFLESYNISKSFLAARGVSISKGISNSSPLESEIKKIIVKNSDKNYVLADSSKLNAISLTTYCNIKDITGLVIEKFPPKNFIDFFHKNNIKIITQDDIYSHDN